MIRDSHGPRLDLGPRRPRSQPQEHRRRHPAPQARGHHRSVGLGQVVARLRHDLRRRAAPLRRVAVGLRAAVPRADGEAGRRSDRRAVAGDLDRAEDHRLESALDGRHGHRNLRLPAAAVREHRRAALPELRQGDRQPVARAHRRHGDALSAGRAHQRARADRPRPQGRVQEGARGAARARLHQGAHRRPVPLARGGHQARSAPQSHHRGGRRSRDRARRRRAPADRVGRRRAQPRRRHRRHQHVRRRRSAVLAAAGLRRLRPQHARDDAARLLVQLAARRLPRVPGARRDDRFRSAARRAGREQVAGRRRDRAVGERRSQAGAGGAAGAVARLRHRSHRAVLAAAAKGARGAAVRRAARRLRRAAAEPAAPLRRRELGRAGRARRVPVAAAVRRLPRRAAEAAEPGGEGEGADDRRLRQPADRRSAARVRRPGADRPRGDHRRADPARDSGAAAVPERRRRRLPDARPQRGDAVGRRRPAHPAGDADRREPHRRALRARRAVDRPAPARQPQAARRRCRGCAISATPSSSSSTTRRRFGPPTT